MHKAVMYVILALIIVAMLTHPAGTAVAMTGGKDILLGESAILSGQNNPGGRGGVNIGTGVLGTTYALA